MGNTDAGNRSKAYRLRKFVAEGEQLAPVDQLWLSDYEEKLQRPRQRFQRKVAEAEAASVGASKSKRTVHLDIDEEKQAVGIGAPTVAALAAGAALEAKEEGRRLDSLTMGALDILREAVGVYKDIALTLKEQWSIMAQQVGDALAASREHFMDLTEAEARIKTLEAEAEGKGTQDVNGLLGQVLAAHLKGQSKSPLTAASQRSS